MSLPPELQQALEADRAQYRAVALEALDEPRLDAGLFALQPRPAAEPDWVGGRIIGFAGEDIAWSAEVVHFDPRAGDVFLAVGEATTLEELLRADAWAFKPFDFAAALTTASDKATRLESALRWVMNGGADFAGVQAATSLEGPWHAPWGLVWGPPGTGKTQALAERIAAEVVAHPERRLLLVAPTNGAIDELTHRLCTVLEQRGQLLDGQGHHRVFRGGTGTRRRLAKDFPDVLADPESEAKAEARERLQLELLRLEARQAAPADIARLRTQLQHASRLEDSTLEAIEKGEATVIATTVHRALRLVTELTGEPHFHKVILDEGGMISRASTVLLASLAGSVLVAGDPRQLGPVTRAPDGPLSHVQKWLRESPLSHLRDANTAQSNLFFLDTQHRMHPRIAKVVSDFQYAGRLRDGPRVLAREVTAPGLEGHRAVWVVLDECTRSARALSHDRPQTGKGYVRHFSAELIVALATRAVDQGYSVLAATPYRAQAQLIRSLGVELPQGLVTSTIHRQQGAEFDVVFIDTVAGGRPFQAVDLTAMLNVAASRARHHLVVLASRGEAESAIPGRFLSAFEQVKVVDGVLQPVQVSLARAPQMPQAPETLGHAIANVKSARPLFTDEQLKLFERHFGDGHYLVRGVAGSGKTFVLANWVARMLAEHRGHRVLISYFTRSLQQLETHHVRAALERHGLDVEKELQRVRIGHADELRFRLGEDELFDAVFVDEAQDMGPQRLQYLFHRAREVLDSDGKRRRRFFLFMDDSQNVYGHQPIEAFREQVDPALSFAGRSRVMKESFRSPREILDLAFNVVLDPLGLHDVPQPGMREFLKENELVKAGLLQRPAEGRSKVYRVGFTERAGAVPRIVPAKDRTHEGQELTRTLRMLTMRERVRPDDVLVVAPTRPAHWAKVLSDAGFPTVAFGGAQGREASELPVGDAGFVRATTLYSSKGHESPVVVFCGLEDLDTLEQGNEALQTLTPREVEQRKRALFYVGATRASVRQYIIGLESSRFLRVAREYAERLSE